MKVKFGHGKIWGTGRIGLVVLVSAVFVVACGSIALGAEEKGSPPAHYRVFTLRHIPAQKGKEYLAQMHLGTVSRFPGAEMLLVTASPRELIKASAVLQLVDSKEEYVVREVFSVSSAHDLPSNERIAAKVGDVAIGTFSEPPASAAAARAIIDLHNEAVIAIAPASHVEAIVSAIVQGQNQGPGTMIAESKLPFPEGMLANLIEGKGATEVEPADSNIANDEFFKRLLNSLAEAEKRAVGEGQEVQEANEPSEVELVPEVDVPIEPTIELTAPPVTDGIGVAELAAIVERLEALEARLQAKTGPSEVEMAPVGIEEPSTEVQYEPEEIPGGNDVLLLNLPPSVTIIEFLDYMAKNLRLTYIYDPAKIKGNVHIKFDGELAGKVERRDLYPLLEYVLQFNGFVMSRKGNLVTVVPEAEADKIDPRFVHEDAGKVKYGDVTLTRIFSLQHVDTATAKNLLTTMQLGLKDKIREVPEIGRLIVTGYAYRMPRIEELLKMIDQPGEPKAFRFKALRFTDARTLAPKVKTLVEQLAEDISISVSGTAAAPLKRKPRESEAAWRRRQAEAKRKPAAKGAPAAKGGKPSLYLDFDERTNRVLMIGYEAELDLVEQFITSLDVPQQDLRTLRSYDIQNIDAEDVREKLAELGIVGAAKTTTTRRGAGPATKGPGAAKPGPKSAVTTTTTTTAEGSLVEEPQVVIIESTNSLLVNATNEQHAQIAMIVAYLDREAFQPMIPYVVYPLENQDPLKLGDILNQFVKETITGKNAKGEKIQRTEKRTEEEIVIIPDENTFSLIVYASKKNQQWIARLIKQLDKRRPQVLIDVTFVQITRDDIFNFDLSLLGAYPNLEYTSGQTGASTSVIDLLLDPARDRDRFLDFTTKAGNFTGFYGDRAINALLTAVETKRYGRVMTKPKILVNDNELGTITTSDTTYIERKERSVIGTQNPSELESSVFDAYSAGVTLNITPHISEGDMLRLEISLNRSGFDPDTLGLEKPPDRADSDISTIVTVPDKSTIILGGMEKVDQGKGGNKVPILGDLPLIGGAFRQVSRTDITSKLYIFVKAHILRPGEETALADLKEVSRKNREAFESLEKEMQVYEDWPGIKPTPFDPLRVLEAD
jgi:general secretion pathway protein D